MLRDPETVNSLDISKQSQNDLIGTVSRQPELQPAAAPNKRRISCRFRALRSTGSRASTEWPSGWRFGQSRTRRRAGTRAGTRGGPAGQVAGLRAYQAVVPGGVRYHDDYQVAGDDYPRMRMQPNDRIRSVIIIFEMKPMSFASGRKLPGPGVFGANSPDSETAVLPCDTRAGAASSTAPRRC